jgi:hypothetical protein
MNDHEELGKNIKKLLALLRKMMTQEGGSGAPMKGNLPPELQQILSDNKNIQLNLCVLAFLPLDPAEFDDMEDALQGVWEDGKDPLDKDALSFEITSSDKDFLKKYGIKF